MPSAPNDIRPTRESPDQTIKPPESSARDIFLLDALRPVDSTSTAASKKRNTADPRPEYVPDLIITGSRADVPKPIQVPNSTRPLGTVLDPLLAPNTRTNDDFIGVFAQRYVRQRAAANRIRDNSRSVFKPPTDNQLSPQDFQSMLRRILDGNVAALIERRPGISEQFSREVDDAMAGIPVAARQLLIKAGYRVVVADRVTNADPSLRGVRPRGWPPGATWDNAEGFQSEASRKIGIAEFRRRGETWERNDRVGGVIRHECGHAMDVALGKNNELLSDSPEFIAALERDTVNIKASDKNQLAYYLQAGASGRSETMADVFALLVGGPCSDSDRAVLQRSFPQVARLIQQKLDALTQK